MLKLVISSEELYDESTNTFMPPKHYVLKLEHSLISVSKWEAKWHKPFLGRTPKTTEENLNYIECMIVTSDYDPTILRYLNEDNMLSISKYIEDPMSATIIPPDNSKSSNDVLTTENIYWYMKELNIPVEFQRWHLNRLITFIKLCGVKAEPPKKMSQSELNARNAKLNAERRAKANSTG